MTRRWNMRAAAAAFLLAACQSLLADQNAGTEPESVRQEFMAAMERIRDRQPQLPDSVALQSYVIYDYLAAARLRRAVALTPTPEIDSAVDVFLQAHGGQPVARVLRHDWLTSLAERKRWDWFLPRTEDTSDPGLVCQRYAGRLDTGDTTGLALEALLRWSLPQQEPHECNAIFAWLRSQGLLTPALAEGRTRAALAADNPRLARDFVAGVPEPLSTPLLQWIQLLDAPKAAVAMLSLNAAMPVVPDALVAGFARLSTSDNAAAASLLPALLARPDVMPALRTRLQRALALGAAYSRSPIAVAAFLAVPIDAADGQAQEWRVRAALWSEDFDVALHWLNDMGPALAAQPRWRYWRARAVAATSGTAAAEPIYAEIAGMRDYYGYLAADRLNQVYKLNIHPSPDDGEVQSALAADPGLIRAHALFDCDLSDEAAGEWAAVLGSAKPATKIQAAHLASRWGWYQQTIATLAQAGEWDDVSLRYPRPYAAIVADASLQTQVPGDWIFGIMRQESLFRKDAVSRADARGLMQMQPATAAAVARRWHLPPPSRQSLFDPSVAISLGAIYIRELLDKYGGQLDQGLAAYNAGPMAVARWLPGKSMDADVWIENIPYTETRGYVQHILEHIVAFAAVRDAPPPRLSTLLPKLAPPSSTHPEDSS